MEKQELIVNVSSFQDDFTNDVIAAFRTSREYGEERLTSWQARFTRFCSTTLPGASDALRQRLQVSGMVIARGESPATIFLRTRGNKVLAFLNSLLFDIKNDDCRFLIVDVGNHPKVDNFVINNSANQNNKVFIVHGHDNSLKLEVARFVESIGLTAVILHEQLDRGQTIIEKIEAHTDVAYAIILYTADDQGYVKNQAEKIKYRARQNVLFEHGFLMAKLTRKKVAYIVESDVELPSDLQGAMYQSREEWKYKLANEIAAAGLEVNLKTMK